MKAGETHALPEESRAVCAPGSEWGRVRSDSGKRGHSRSGQDLSHPFRHFIAGLIDINIARERQAVPAFAHTWYT